jgi:hypothetical protein
MNNMKDLNFSKMAEFLSFRVSAKALRVVTGSTPELSSANEIKNEMLANEIAPYLATAIQEAYQLGFLAGQKTGNGVLKDVLDGIPNRNPFAIVDDKAEAVEKLENRLAVFKAGINLYTSHYRDNGDHSHDADIEEYQKQVDEILECLAVHRK